MRQTLKDRRKQLHSTMPTSRLFTMALMLAILGLIFVRLRDPDTWRWFAREIDDETQLNLQSDPAGSNPAVARPSAAPASSSAKTTPAERDQQAGAASPAAAPGQGQATPEQKGKSGPTKEPPAAASRPVSSAAVPAASGTREFPRPKDSTVAPPAELTPTGPTDLDPMEQEDIKEAISIITDGNLEMSKLDMPAYFQILSWVDHQPTELLLKRAKRDVLYSDFRKTPDSVRLQIVELKLNVRQVIRLTNPPKNGITTPMTTREGNPIYEIRGFTQEGGSNLYFGIVTDLPKGMPIGTSVNENARLVGYFFKLQGYISKVQQLEAEQTRRRPVPLKAPVIIGRLIWTATSSEAEAAENLPFWLLATIGSVAAVIVVGWVWLNARSSRRPGLPAVMVNTGLDPEGPGVDNWLDQAQAGRLTLDPTLDAGGRSNGAGLEGSFGHRSPGNIFGENGESNNGHGDSGASVHDDGNPSRG